MCQYEVANSQGCSANKFDICVRIGLKIHTNKRKPNDNLKCVPYIIICEEQQSQMSGRKEQLSVIHVRPSFQADLSL